MQVVFTPLAMRHLTDLHDYIASEASVAIADGYIGRIVHYCERLDLFPERGRRRDDILPGLRLVGFERRVTIAFMVVDDQVLIEGIFYGGRDVVTGLTKDVTLP